MRLATWSALFVAVLAASSLGATEDGRARDGNGRPAAPPKPAQTGPRDTPAPRPSEGSARTQPVAPSSPSPRPVAPPPSAAPPPVPSQSARELPPVRRDEGVRTLPVRPPAADPRPVAPTTQTPPPAVSPRPTPRPVEERSNDGARNSPFRAQPHVEPGRAPPTSAVPAASNAPSASRPAPAATELPLLHERRHLENAAETRGPMLPEFQRGRRPNATSGSPAVAPNVSSRDSGRRTDATEGVASVPERSMRSASTYVKMPLVKLDRSATPTTVAHADSLPRPPRPSSHIRTRFDVDVHFWWSDPCNRFVSWRGCGGWECGYVFCGPTFYWYWWRPGCDPWFTPYCYYWRPASYCLPAYYPSYAYVRYVDDYVVDDYPTLTTAPAPAPTGVDFATLVANGWTSFHAAAYPDAVESFRQAVLAKPDDAQAKSAYAQALFAVGDYADAAFLIRRAIELLPDWPVTGEDPRARYADPADHAEQMVALRSFLDHVPGDPAATLVLAVQSYFTGDLTVARESFASLASLDPDDRVVKLFLERLGPAPAPKK